MFFVFVFRFDETISQILSLSLSLSLVSLSGISRSLALCVSLSLFYRVKYTKHSPYATGNGLYYKDHMDGAFSSILDFVIPRRRRRIRSDMQDNEDSSKDEMDMYDYDNDCCTVSLSLPMSLKFFSQVLHVNMKPSTAVQWYQLGYDKYHHHHHDDSSSTSS